jgi:signal transduction histidine kinase
VRNFEDINPDHLSRAAAVLEDNAPEICADYERRLRAMGSPLVADDEARKQLEVQARLIIKSTAEILRGQEPYAGQDENHLSETIGVSRARDNVHPSESFRAVRALSGAALSVVAEKLPPSWTSRSEVAAVALAIQESIMDRVTNAAVSYGAYLLDKIHESHADERRRIGRELHDRLAPEIVTIHHSLEMYEALKVGSPAKAETKVRVAGSKAQEALTLIKELSTELRISKAPEGLEVAISDFLRTSVPSRIRSWVSVKGDESTIKPHVRDELFLIMREAVRNAAVHSRARKIRVELAVAPDKVTVLVEDDGRGFEPVGGSASGTGLKSMEERASLLGGVMHLSSRPGSGTKVAVHVPLPRSHR